MMSKTLPRPRSATKLFAITTVYEGLDLLAHWLEHYSRLGADEMLIGVGFREGQDFVGGSDPLSNITPGVIGLCRDYPTRVFPFKYENYSCQLNLPLRRAMKHIAGVGPDDWCMHADLDEFYSFPCHVRELMWEMEDKNDWAVQGWILDRVAQDGTLRDIAPSVNLGEQFPFGCQLTGRFIRANTRKIMLCRGRVRVNGPHDTTRNARHSRKPIDGSYVAHHFRWTGALMSRVNRRIEENYVGKCYRRELLHLQKHWHEHQSLPLAAPSLDLRYVGPLLYPQ